MGTSRDRFPLYDHVPNDIGWVPAGKVVLVEPDVNVNSDALVYRYCSLAEAFMLVHRRTWSFVRPRTWPDKYETHVSEELFENAAAFAAIPGFVKCVSLEHSSEAMWRTYATTGGLVRISWRLGDLLKVLDDADWGGNGKVYVARVRYMDAPDIRAAVEAIKTATTEEQKSRHAMRALMMKRMGFAFENEVRICVFPSSPPPQDFTRATGISSDTIARVLIDPYLSPWQADEIKAVLKDVLHLASEVEQSKFNTVFRPSAA